MSSASAVMPGKCHPERSEGAKPQVRPRQSACRRIYLNPTVDLVGYSYSGRLGGGYTERLVNFGLGVLFQTGK